MNEIGEETWDEGTPARWAVDPERADPDDFAPGRVFVKVMTWAPCDACGIQAHTPATQFLLRGLSCPQCGLLLLAAPENAMERISTLLRQEDEMAEQV
jgi:hypothetical protein